MSRFLALLIVAVAWVGCATRPRFAPGQPLVRNGDEIIVCGQWFHTGTRVITWMDPGGYDAYRVERRFAPFESSDWDSTRATGKGPETPNRFGLRRDGLDAAMRERVRGGGWKLGELQERVDQFVIHFDATGTSRRCFEVLHDQRGLSVHFMLDVDGTLYQTLDLKERAWHATTSNSRSIGIEIAQAGAHPVAQRHVLDSWYARDDQGIRLIFPDYIGDPGIATPGFVGRPARPDPIIGRIQGNDLIQYDFTPQQYDALGKLAAALHEVLPRIRLEAPRGPEGQVIPNALSPSQLENHSGLLGHYHVQPNKVDPGPAFNWEHLLALARKNARR
ncbi:MAG: N-acetylmuramoyl-L-alanine amidase [Verrucomicrobiota bacterium]|jgi:N-acetyl-anhydromuramyl-L-alanine amidase AmpD